MTMKPRFAYSHDSTLAAIYALAVVLRKNKDLPIEAREGLVDAVSKTLLLPRVQGSHSPNGDSLISTYKKKRKSRK